MEIYGGQQSEAPYAISNKPVDVVKRLVPIHNFSRNVKIDNWITNYGRRVKTKQLSLVRTLKRYRYPVYSKKSKIKKYALVCSSFRINLLLLMYRAQTKILRNLTTLTIK